MPAKSRGIAGAPRRSQNGVIGSDSGWFKSPQGGGVMTMHWEIVPAVDFTTRKHWKSIGDDRWAALRLRLLYVRTNGKEARLGPVVEEHDVVKGDKITLRFKRQRVVTRTESVNDAIRESSAARILEGLSSKVSSELSAKVPGFSGKLQSDLSSNSEREVTSEVERTLTHEASHSLEDTEGFEYEIELDGEGGARRAKLRRRYWPRQWDVYLHSYDYLELSYHRNWRWKQIRKTMKRIDGQRLGWPLVSLTFYEPQADLIVSYDPVANELETPDSFEPQPLTKTIPASSGPKLQDLEVAAQIAFPASRSERAAAKQGKGTRGGTEAIAFAGRAAKKRVKASAKRRSASKKTVRKSAVKPRKRVARHKK
jgi:hypothetical protein